MSFSVRIPNDYYSDYSEPYVPVNVQKEEPRNTYSSGNYIPKQVFSNHQPPQVQTLPIVTPQIVQPPPQIIVKNGKSILHIPECSISTEFCSVFRHLFWNNTKIDCIKLLLATPKRLQLSLVDVNSEYEVSSYEHSGLDDQVIFEINHTVKTPCVLELRMKVEDVQETTDEEDEEKVECIIQGGLVIVEMN